MGLAAVQAVLDHRNAVHRALHIAQGRRWRPIYMRTDDGTVLAQPWAAGFVSAVKRWPVAWRPMFERNDHVGLMLPIIACSEAEEVDKLMAGRRRKSVTTWAAPTTTSPKPFAASATIGATTKQCAEPAFAAPSSRDRRGVQTTVTTEERLRVVRETMGSGVIVQAMADRHGVSTSQLYTWRKQMLASAMAVLVPVEVVPEASQLSALIMGEAPTSSAAPGIIEITLPSGANIRLSGGADAATLRLLLAELGGR